MGSPSGVAGDELAAPLLKTKLQPPGSPRLLRRERLLDAISEGMSQPLTLVYGPAGSGKTMLVAQWLASPQREPAVAWLSLDAGDNDPTRFWTYVVEALRSVSPGFGEEVLAMLRAPGLALLDAALLELTNELVDGTARSALVLDDYHVIADQRIHDAMASLLERLPSTLRIVITSRTEPPVGIGRLRARGQLNEIDAARLRVSQPEAASLLNDVHDLGLPDELIASLNERTEGWAAGLYLAVLSMRGRQDVASFIESFAGSDRRVVDYLGTEVLAEQDDEEVEFLLQTSVLERFCVPLCDAVTGSGNSRAMLDRIERTNYFVIPLDPSHDWYRYHHLFGDLLRHELQRRTPEAATTLHRRAGRWFLDAELVSEAIDHLTAAGDLDEVSELISTNWLSFTNVGQRTTVARWLDALPRDHILSDGRLCLARARTASVVGERGEILEWLDHADRAPSNSPSDDVWRGEQATVLRSTAHELLGDMGRARDLAARLEPLDGSSFWHALAASNLGSAAHWRGDAPEAAALLETTLVLNRDRIAMVSVFARGRLALIASEAGDWRTCAAQVETAFELVRARGLEEYWQCSLAHAARGRLLQHDRRRAEARVELERGVALARRGVGVVELSYVLVSLAELTREMGDRRAARELVVESREVLSGAPDPGTLVPRLVAQAEAALRLVLRQSGSRPVATDRLTAREQAVLLLLPGGLSAREIAVELGVSRDTIKTHTRSIYRKLGASSRREAVARARSLELL